MACSKLTAGKGLLFILAALVSLVTLWHCRSVKYPVSVFTWQRTSNESQANNGNIRADITRKSDFFSMYVTEDDIESFSVQLPEKLPNFKSHCWREMVPSNFSYSRHSFYYNRRNLRNRRQTFSGLQRLIEERKNGRTDAHSWRMRCFPFYFILGFNKCGTTDLHKILVQLPDVFPAVIKEPIYWHYSRLLYREHKGKYSTLIPRLSDYLDMFDGAAESIRRYNITTKDGATYHPGVVGDCNPKTMWSTEYWQNIKGNENQDEPRYLTAHHLYHIYPRAKFLVIMRNPVDRIFSYFKKRTRGSVDIRLMPKVFHEETLPILHQFETCFKEKSVRFCVYNIMKRPHSPTKRVERGVIGGIYYVFIKDWLKVFPREQFLFIKSEDYYSNRTHVIQEIIEFLQLDSSVPYSEIVKLSKLKITNKSFSLRMWNRTQIVLQEFFQPSNEELARLLNDEKWRWYSPDFSY